MTDPLTNAAATPATRAPEFLTAVPAVVSRSPEVPQPVVTPIPAPTAQARPSAAFSPTHGAVAGADFTRTARAVFGRIDRDRDGHLSRAELSRAMGDSTFRGAEAAAVATLFEQNDELQTLANDEWGSDDDGTTLADLDAFARLDPSEPEWGSPAFLDSPSRLRWSTESIFGLRTDEIAHTSRTLLPNGLASIHGGAVRQGRVDDGNFIAALAGLADQNPDAIRRMIRENGDQTFTVTFPGRAPVTITAPTDAEVTRNSSTASDGLWVTVLEKAYARMRNRDALVSSADDYEAIEGGSVGDGIQALTGHDTTEHSTRFTSEAALVADMQAALADRRLVTADVRSGVLGRPFFEQGLRTDEVYTIQRIDPVTHAITVRDNTGIGGRADDGVHTFTPAEFGRVFHTVSIEDRR